MTTTTTLALIKTNASNGMMLFVSHMLFLLPWYGGVMPFVAIAPSPSKSSTTRRTMTALSPPGPSQSNLLLVYATKMDAEDQMYLDLADQWLKQQDEEKISQNRQQQQQQHRRQDQAPLPPPTAQSISLSSSQDSISSVESTIPSFEADYLAAARKRAAAKKASMNAAAKDDDWKTIQEQIREEHGIESEDDWETKATDNIEDGEGFGL
mmetsp:Transcript_2496/g.5437  ORF Transcript_2496/g.5437 Transcript_2496/m.5437 type:complete len:209 (-) Transcript_2496:275-901(-)